jgi:hypothetical protein
MTRLWELLSRRRKPVDMIKRRHAWGVAHYGEIIPGKQHRLKRKIFDRLSNEDYRCRLPDAKHPVIKVKMLKREVKPCKQYYLNTYYGFNKAPGKHFKEWR